MPTAKARTRNSKGARKPNLRVVPSKPDESKYRVLFDQASDAIVTLRPDWKVDECNHAFEDLFGYLKGEISGLSIDALSPDPSHHRIPERSRPLERRMLETGGTYEDVAVLRADGYVLLVEMSIRRVKSEDAGELAVALIRDMTEKKKLERELITKHAELRNAYVELEKKTVEMRSMQDSLVQAGKMAALGELAAGIAHELNQPLQGIRGYAQELQALLSPDLSGLRNGAGVGMGLKEIISNSDKMAAIIQHLRVFIRKSTEEHREVDVHEAIEEALKMMARQLQSHGIAVAREYGRDIPRVYANPLQLEQVFINLASNARDAIDETGRGDGKITIRTRSRGRFVEVEFSDDGAGMNEKTRAKAFNPFFTTKEVGKGMGLGLSLSYGIINKIHGSIMVESQLGRGTKFNIKVPIDFREEG